MKLPTYFQRHSWAAVVLVVLAVFAVAMILRSNNTTRVDIQEEVAPYDNVRDVRSDASLDKGVPDNVIDGRAGRRN